MSRALQVGTRKADGNNIPFDLPLSTQNGGTGSTTGATRASLGLATTDTVVFGQLQPTTPLAAIYGGTGFSSFTIGAVPYGKTPTTLDWVLPNTTTTPNYYTSTGTGVAGQTPEWKTPTQVKTDLSLNNVENTALSTWAGSTNVTTLGTVATGTWNATAIGPTKGGTNQTSYATGDTLYASASNTLSKLSGNTTSTVNYLTQTGNGSASAAPVWKTPTQMRTDLGLATSSNAVFNSLDVITGGIRTPSCNYRKKTDQSINTGTFTAITFSNGPASACGEWDNNSWHPSSDSSFTTPSFYTGVYNVSGNLCFDQNGTGSRQAAIYDSGTGQYRYVIVPACSANYTIVPFSWNIRTSSSADTITLYAWQDSGGALNVKGASTEGYTILSIACVSQSS